MAKKTTKTTDTSNTHSNAQSSSTQDQHIDVSIVIPVYNEEGIISAALADLTEKLRDVDFKYEIIIAENGSKDQTVAIAKDFSSRHPEVNVFSIGEPNYGKALKEGIFRARGTYVICDEIDLCDTGFYQAALQLLRHENYQFVVGSKRAMGAKDKRPLYRRVATQVLNGLLNVAVGFEGTDTHGLKAFNKPDIIDLVEECVVDRDMFASELTVRVHRAKRRWIEIPIELIEKRPPSISLFKRVPNVLKNIARLTMIIRFGRDL
jgi:glycosyltransferase involved in cell wall biosynthesis